MDRPDFTKELSQLLIFISKIAFAIQQCTREGSGPRGLYAANLDAMHLSDTLTALHRLGRALVDLPADRIAAVCDDLDRQFKAYQLPGIAQEIFDRYGANFRLESAIDIFARIKAKIAPAAALPAVEPIARPRNTTQAA